MARYQLTDDAEHDLDAIAEYTYLNHGEKQAELYRDSLRECFSMLSDYPNIQQDVGHILKGAKRHDTTSAPCHLLRTRLAAANTSHTGRTTRPAKTVRRVEKPSPFIA